MARRVRRRLPRYSFTLTLREAAALLIGLGIIVSLVSLLGSLLEEGAI